LNQQFYRKNYIFNIFMLLIFNVIFYNYCTYNWPHSSPYLIHTSWCFHVKFRWELIKFTSFVSYRAYNVFCLTFRRNLRVLIERKILKAILRKNGDLTMTRTAGKSKTKDGTTVQQGSTAVRRPRCGVSRCLELFNAISVLILGENLL